MYKRQTALRNPTDARGSQVFLLESCQRKVFVLLFMFERAGTSMLLVVRPLNPLSIFFWTLPIANTTLASERHLFNKLCGAQAHATSHLTSTASACLLRNSGAPHDTRPNDHAEVGRVVPCKIGVAPKFAQVGSLLEKPHSLSNSRLLEKNKRKKLS